MVFGTEQARPRVCQLTGIVDQVQRRRCCFQQPKCQLRWPRAPLPCSGIGPVGRFSEWSLTDVTPFTIVNHMVKYSEDQLNATFGALSDPTRRAILSRLAKGEAQVTELAAPFGMSLPAVSKHLKVLEKANLVVRHKDGRVHRFVVNPKPVRSAISWVEQYQQFWEQQLDALGRYLETNQKKEK